MSRNPTRGAISGPRLAVVFGVIGGLALLALTQFDIDVGGPRIDRTGRVAISINGVDPRMARDVLLPKHGWSLQIHFPDITAADARAGLKVMLRSERTGATIQIEDRFDYEDGLATLTIPESIGIAEGLLSVRVSFTNAREKQFEASHRIRIRPWWFGGSPIGSRQVIHFDFEVDRDGDEMPDFLEDLEYFGLASRDQPKLARTVAARIEERAIARVEQTYDSTDDPNKTGKARDQVHVRFQFTSEPGALVTRICVGEATRRTALPSDTSASIAAMRTKHRTSAAKSPSQGSFRRNSRSTAIPSSTGMCLVRSWNRKAERPSGCTRKIRSSCRASALAKPRTTLERGGGRTSHALSPFSETFWGASWPTKRAMRSASSHRVDPASDFSEAPRATRTHITSM